MIIILNYLQYSPYTLKENALSDKGADSPLPNEIFHILFAEWVKKLNNGIIILIGGYFLILPIFAKIIMTQIIIYPITLVIFIKKASFFNIIYFKKKIDIRKNIHRIQFYDSRTLFL